MLGRQLWAPVVAVGQGTARAGRPVVRVVQKSGRSVARQCGGVGRLDLAARSSW
jgi:hypothetical protein